MNTDKSKIFINGCSRSGTTLMLRLFRAFKDTYTYPKEAHYTKFAELDAPESFHVIKRNAKTRFDLDKIDSDIRIVHLVRHPYDVLTSFHPGSKRPDKFYLKPEQWLEHFDVFKRTINRATPPAHIVLRYEDVISSPDTAQKHIQAFTGLENEKLFSEIENISSGSLCKYRHREDFRDYLKSLPRDFMKTVEAFCNENGYDSKIEAA